MASKTSILIFYLRIARNTQKLLRIASYITLAIVNIAGFILTFMNAFQCSPVSAAYSADSTGHCMSIVTIYLCQAPVNIITDLAILVLPIPVLTGMRLPQRQKTILVFTFTLGIFVTVVDVVRIYYLQQAADNQSLTHSRIGTGQDFSYNVSTALMWSAVEVNVGIICACIPTLKPLIHRILPSMLVDRHISGSDKDRTTFFDSQAATGANGRSHELSSISNGVPRIQPLPHYEQGVHLDDAMNTMTFLTATGTDIDIERRASSRTQATDQTVYFGFIDMHRPKSMLRARGREAFIYCTVVTILFFLWGFSYGLLNSLNAQISQVAHQSVSQTLGLTTAYFGGGYLFGPLTVGQWVLRHGGFKATFIVGLCIYGTGTLMFWPSAVLASFPGFLICNFVVGFGLGILETAANPFIALCGPAKYAEYRLLLAQGVQGVGSVLSQLLAQRALFSRVLNSPTLIDVQWTYLAVALFTVLLALFFYYMPLPEASDLDLQLQSDDIGVYPTTPSVLGPRIPLIYLTLALAVFAQFLYVAAQESMSAWFGVLLATLSTPNTSTSLTLSLDGYSSLSHTTFAISRFLFAPLCLVIPPRILLLVTMVGGIICATLTMSLQINVNALAAPALMFFFFEGPVWPLIFAIGLRGMGKRTKLASACLTAGASGGGPFPFVQLGIMQGAHKSVQYSFCVLVALFSFGTIFPLYLNLVPGARHQVDPIEQPNLGDDGHLREGRGPAIERPSNLSHRMSRSFKAVISQVSGNRPSTERISQDVPVVQHQREDSRGEEGNSSFLSDTGVG
jgi:fucose permease